jgi:hypothetical protein
MKMIYIIVYDYHLNIVFKKYRIFGVDCLGIVHLSKTFESKICLNKNIL